MKTITQITMTVYHDGIDDDEIRKTAQDVADYIEECLHHDTGGIEVDIPRKYVTVNTIPFKVE